MPQRGAASIAVGIIWAVQITLFLFAWYGLIGRQRTKDRLSLQVRIFLSFSLVVAAFLISYVNRSSYSKYSDWIFYGMVLSFIGDLILSEMVILPAQMPLGAMAFSIAHGCYITGYAGVIPAEGREAFNFWLWVGIALYQLTVITSWKLLIFNPKKSIGLNVIALVYGMWIGVMASFALGLAAALGGPWWMTAVGALSFVVSDMIIGITGIGGKSIPNRNDWIWLTYIVGQMGIIYAGWVQGI